ncbi:MAG: DNA repair protein RecO [Candidatus Paceibacterota bacterium]
MYHTEGFVLGGRNVGEAHRMVSLFTRELGLVRAHAKSVREERSKLRFGLQTFALTNVSLIRGKDMWRITGASVREDTYRVLKNDKRKIRLLSKISSLLSHVLYGEEQSEELYELFRISIEALVSEEFSDKELSSFEEILVLRVFHLLGYVGEDEELSPFFGRAFRRENMEYSEATKRKIIRHINEALAASKT